MTSVHELLDAFNAAPSGLFGECLEQGFAELLALHPEAAAPVRPT